MHRRKGKTICSVFAHLIFARATILCQLSPKQPHLGNKKKKAPTPPPLWSGRGDTGDKVMVQGGERVGRRRRSTESTQPTKDKRLLARASYAVTVPIKRTGVPQDTCCPKWRGGGHAWSGGKQRCQPPSRGLGVWGTLRCRAARAAGGQTLAGD